MLTLRQIEPMFHFEVKIMGAAPRPQGRKEKRVISGKSVGSAGESVYAYELDGDFILKKLGKRLPEGAALAIVSPKRYGSNAFGKAIKVKKRIVFHFSKPKSTATKPAKAKVSKVSVAQEAFQPDARARALLRGIELAERDLKSSGGAYTLTDVRRLMRGISRQAINDRVHEGTLLAVSGPSNRAVYPVVQFLQDGKPVDGIKAVREALGTANSWMILNFLINAEPKLNGRKPIELLKAGKMADVVEVARRVGEQGA